MEKILEPGPEPGPARSHGSISRRRFLLLIAATLGGSGFLGLSSASADARAVPAPLAPADATPGSSPAIGHRPERPRDTYRQDTRREEVSRSRDLRSVIPIAQSSLHDDVLLTLFSLEAYETSFLVRGCLLIEQYLIADLALPHERSMLDPRLEAIDDRGTRYQRHMASCGGRRREYSFEYRFTPALDPTARSLQLEAPELHLVPITAWLEEAPAPATPVVWEFTLPLPAVTDGRSLAARHQVHPDPRTLVGTDVSESWRESGWRLGNLRSVIPIGRTEVHDDLELTWLSLEASTEGSRLVARTALRNGRSFAEECFWDLRAPVELTDDRGTRYHSTFPLCGGSGDSESRRESLEFMPAIDPLAHELRIEVPEFQTGHLDPYFGHLVPHPPFAETWQGPWVTMVPLSDKLPTT